MTAPGYRTQIDGLRAVCLLLVLFTHFWRHSPAGHWGVRLFFIISGYLITGILLRNRPERLSQGGWSMLGAFYGRRLLRLLPAYYLVLAVAVLVNVDNVRQSLVWQLLQLSNLLIALRGDWRPWPVSHFWSLSVEEQFYLVWPLIVLTVPRRALAPLMATGIVLSTLFKVYFAAADPGGLFQTVLPPASVDALAAGGMVASLSLVFGFSESRLRSAARLLLWTSPPALVALGAALALRAPEWVGDALLLAPMSGLILAASIGLPGPVGAMLDHPWLRWLGRISYGAYLWHFVVLSALFRLVPGFTRVPPGALQFLVAGTATILVAAGSWYLLERPLNRLKLLLPYRVR